MASRRTRRAIGQGLSAAGESVGDLFRMMSQLGLQREKQEFEKGEQERDRRMELASILLGMADPEQLTPEVLRDLLANIEGGEFGKIPIKIPRPETRLGDLRTRIMEADEPEKIAGLGSPDLAAAEFLGQGGRFIRPGQIAPVGSPVRAALGGLEPQPNLEALGAVGQLARVGREREAALKPFIPTERVEEFDPETLAQTFEMVPQTEMAGRTGLAVPSPEDKAVKDLLAAVSAADRPESERLFDIESGRRLGEEARKQQILTEEANKRAAFSKGLEGAGATRIPAGAQERIAASDSALATLTSMEQLIQLPSVRASVGPVAGRWASFKAEMPPELVEKLPEKFPQFIAESATLKNATIKAITGAQMSNPEAMRIMEQIPLISDRLDVWTEKAAATRRNLVFMRQRMLELAGAAGEPGAEPSAAAGLVTGSGRRIVVRR